MRFGLPRSPASSSERGHRSKPKSSPSKPKGNAKLKTPSKSTPKQIAAAPSPSLRPYRRGTSFGLREDSSSCSSDSGSASEESSSDTDGPRKFGTRSSDDEASDDFVFDAYQSEESSDERSEDSFDFRVSTGLNGQRLARVPAGSKGKGKAKAVSSPRALVQSIRSPEQARDVDETISAIRLRTRFHDPYEEWERNTRLESIRTARKALSTSQTTLQASHQEQESRVKQALATQHTNQMAEVQNQLEALRIKQDTEEAKLREEWKLRDKQLWERIERVIGIEESKVRARQEEERKRQEEADRKKREAEEKVRAEQERLRQEQEAKDAEVRKKKELEEKQRKEAEEEARKLEEEAKKLEEAARLNAEQASREKEIRHALGYRTGDDEWRFARTSLLELKDTVLAGVKGDPNLKKVWSAARRKITPKVGQLTNDDESINRISMEILQLLQPTPPHPRPVYTALCSSFAKAVLLQAETEVTAEKKAAIPLARLVFNLLTTLDGVFREVFWAKLVQRTGGWVVPSVVPFHEDVDGRKWGQGPKGHGRGRRINLGSATSSESNERFVIMGYRKSENGDSIETPAEYAMRMSGISRVYWEIVKVQLRFPNRAFVDGPGCGQRVDPQELAEMQKNGGLSGQYPQSPFGVARFWMWFARMGSVRPLLETGVGAELVHTALEVMGAEAADIWGWQWIKVLELMYDGATKGLYPERALPAATPAFGAPSTSANDKNKKENVTMGGTSAEGKAARARVQIEVERIVRGEKRAIT